MIIKDVMIIGAGASGLMCAIEAGKRGRRVTIIDHAKEAGIKIRISGGGRCNFTNNDIHAGHYLSENSHFCKSAISRFTSQSIITFINNHGISCFEKGEGQLFCRGSSRELVTMLLKECRSHHVDVKLNCRILKIEKEKKGERRFIVTTARGRFLCRSLVVASGGLSYPQLGATDIGYRIAEQFSLRVTPISPALVPLSLNAMDLKVFRELSGISIHVEVRYKDKKFKGDMLFTHRGISGPAILQVSSYWKKGNRLVIDLIPDRNIDEVIMSKLRSRLELKNLLSGYLPKKFAHTWCRSYAPSKPLNQYNDKELKDIINQVHHWEIRPAGSEGFRKAEVTLGGVDTAEISSKTMAARKVPGLYFIGEVLDVTGEIGGYNLHWAWASGYAAGQYV